MKQCTHPYDEQQIHIYAGVIKCGACGAVTGRAGFYDPFGYDDDADENNEDTNGTR